MKQGALDIHEGNSVGRRVSAMDIHDIHEGKSVGRRVSACLEGGCLVQSHSSEERALILNVKELNLLSLVLCYLNCEYLLLSQVRLH